MWIHLKFIQGNLNLCFMWQLNDLGLLKNMISILYYDDNNNINKN